MKIYQMLEECIEQGKKFECDTIPFENCVIQRGTKTGDVYIAYKDTNKYCARFDCNNMFINANYTEYDPTVYMDFISACKLSKENGVWIKRKNASIHDKIQVRDVRIFLYQCETFQYTVGYDDIIAEDWHVVENTK